MHAPYYYTEVDGDFVLKIKVSHEFKDTYDSASVMVTNGLKCWAKCCFELTDFVTHAAVSMVTKGDSDDANGCNIEGNTAWLQVCRLGKIFALHYSADGKNFYMMRYFHLPVESTVKVGLLAQAPTGDGGIRVYENLSIEKNVIKYQNRKIIYHTKSCNPEKDYSFIIHFPLFKRDRKSVV